MALNITSFDNVGKYYYNIHDKHDKRKEKKNGFYKSYVRNFKHMIVSVAQG